jgi:hypothetical protein
MKSDRFRQRRNEMAARSHRQLWAEHIDQARIVARGGMLPFDGFSEIAAKPLIAAIH